MCKVYIYFKKIKGKKSRKTGIWSVTTDNDDEIGHIVFDGAWRQYIFLPDAHTKWSASCNDQISAFLKQQNEKWRNKLAKKRKVHEKKI